MKEQRSPLRKKNEQSGLDFKFIKFITRKLIRIKNRPDTSGVSQSFSFFYPFEVQIMDAASYDQILLAIRASSL